MPFLILMIFGTLLIASAAVFFSVLGLVQTFSETAIYWGTSIEVAKLIIASFIYRYWNETTKITKTVSIFLIAMLMSITSLGIYGHIITSYQEGNLQVENQNIRLETAEDRLNQIRQRIEVTNDRIESNRARLAAIEADIARVPDDFVTARRELIQEHEPEKKAIQERIDALFDERDSLFSRLENQQTEISTLRIETGEVENKVGPIMFVVETLGATGEKAVFWFVLIIVLSFDPAAVALTIYSNKVALSLRKDDDENVDKATIEVPLPTQTPPASVSVESSTQQPQPDLNNFLEKMSNAIEENNSRLSGIQDAFDKDKSREELIKKATR